MSDEPGHRRLPCPCCIRRAERVTTTMRRRVVSALAAAGLAGLAALCLSAGPARAEPAAGAASLLAPRIALIAIAVGAVGSFTVLQVIARSPHRRPRPRSDWRTRPPACDRRAGAHRGDPVPGGQECPARERGYGSPPGYGRGARPSWSARRDLPRHWPS